MTTQNILIFVIASLTCVLYVRMTFRGILYSFFGFRLRFRDIPWYRKLLFSIPATLFLLALPSVIAWDWESKPVAGINICGITILLTSIFEIIRYKKTRSALDVTLEEALSANLGSRVYSFSEKELPILEETAFLLDQVQANPASDMELFYIPDSSIEAIMHVYVDYLIATGYKIWKTNVIKTLVRKSSIGDFRHRSLITLSKEGYGTLHLIIYDQLTGLACFGSNTEILPSKPLI